MALTDTDLDHLRRAIAWSERGFAAGERPFGAIIVGPDGAILAETHGRQVCDRDPTAHAEVTAIRALGGAHDRATLAGATLYSSTEPCAMCAAAIYWSHIGRLVFGLSEARLRAVRNTAEATALTMGCRAVLETGGHPTVVEGPVLEDEALRAHRSFWRTVHD